ncbi:hypothetical protein [Mesorhizobium sp.]|nr:hypothetical protein [Mesorhizobium sp.]
MLLIIGTIRLPLDASATEPAELLAIFVAEDNCGPLTIPAAD